MMDEKQKHKNSDNIVTGYDRGGPYSFYRRLGLSRTRRITVAASPENRIARLKTIEDNRAYAHRLEGVSLPTGYEFQMEIWEPRGFGKPEIIGSILPDEEQDGQSHIILRAYPSTLDLIYALGIFLTAFAGLGYLTSSDIKFVPLCLILIFLFVLPILISQTDSLDHVANHLLELQHTPPHQPKAHGPENMQRKI